MRTGILKTQPSIHTYPPRRAMRMSAAASLHGLGCAAS